MKEVSKKYKTIENKAENLVSVIIPIYNVEKYLPKCLDSVINQTYKNLEIILVDDGSPDNSGKICDEYAKKDKRIKVIHKNNGGVSSARNVGLSETNGNWIAFIDSDDWIEINYIEILINVAIRNNSDIVICGYNRVVGDNSEALNCDNTVRQYNKKKFLLYCLTPQTGFGFCHMKIIKKDIIKDIKFSENLTVGEDALFNIMLSENIKNDVSFVKKALYNYRINNDSVVKKFDNNYVSKYLKAIQINKKYLFENYQDLEIKQGYYNFAAFHVLLIAVNYCFNKENKNQIECLKKVCDIKEFKEAIKKSNYHGMSITRKITLFTIKHKLFYITALICEIRKKQNNN